MVKLKNSEIRQVDAYFVSEPGYILDFSNATFAEFFEDELSLDIYSENYAVNGNSKAKRLRTFLGLASPTEAAKLLRALWKIKTREERSHLEGRLQMAAKGYLDPEAYELESTPSSIHGEEFEELVSEIEGREESGALQGIEILAKEFDFDTVLNEVERAKSYIDKDPEDAITAACSLLESVCRSILVELKQPLPKDLSISPLYKSVREPLGLSPKKDGISSLISADVRQILSGLTNSVGGIGSLRTHGGDVHGREKGVKRVDARIARLSVNSASAIAIFLIESWNSKFPKRTLKNIDATKY